MLDIEFFAIKKVAVESLLADNVNKELLAERLIMLLDGDLTLLDELVSGIPTSLLDYDSKLKLAAYMSEKVNSSFEAISDVKVSARDVLVGYSYKQRRWFRPDDIEGMKRVMSGKPAYNEDCKYSETAEYSTPVEIIQTAEETIPVSKLVSYGVEFNRL